MHKYFDRAYILFNCIPIWINIWPKLRRIGERNNKRRRKKTTHKRERQLYSEFIRSIVKVAWHMVMVMVMTIHYNCSDCIQLVWHCVILKQWQQRWQRPHNQLYSVHEFNNHDEEKFLSTALKWCGICVCRNRTFTSTSTKQQNLNEDA